MSTTCQALDELKPAVPDELLTWLTDRRTDSFSALYIDCNISESNTQYGLASVQQVKHISICSHGKDEVVNGRQNKNHEEKQYALMNTWKAKEGGSILNAA